MHDGEGNIVAEKPWTHRCPECFETFDLKDAPRDRGERFASVDDYLYGYSFSQASPSPRVPAHPSRVSSMNPCSGSGKTASPRYLWR